MLIMALEQIGAVSVNSPRKWVIVLPIAIGLAVLFMLKGTGTTPPREKPKEKATPVNVIPAPSVTVVPKAIGQGTAKPGKTWSAITQVKGKIIEKHPRLSKGAILKAGSIIAKVDPTDYQLAITQTEADIQGIEAQQQELNAKATNTRASLKIEKAALELNQKELQRKRKLVAKGSVSRSDLETQERSLLAQQQSVQSHRNSLNLIPSQLALLRAELARKQVALTSARRDLANTEIYLPFTSRISSVQVEEMQYVSVGENIAMADGLERAEIEIPLTIGQISALLHSDKVINVMSLGSGTNQPPTLGLSARVKLQESGITATWPARFARLSDALDPKTRTVGVIVEVDEPYANIQPGKRPPLVKGLFVEVTLAGKPRPNRIVIPRSALHGHQIYIINAQQRLEIRRVKVELLQPDFVVVGSGLSEGEQVVTSDLLPAIEGMLLQPHKSSNELARLLQAASSQEK